MIAESQDLPWPCNNHVVNHDAASMSMEDRFHRRATEYAHNEVLSLLMVILGTNLLIGGLIVVFISTSESYLAVVYLLASYSGILGLILASAGALIISAGFILAVYYDKRRSWYLSQLEKSAMPDEPKAALEMANKILQEYVGIRKKQRKDTKTKRETTKEY